MSASAQGGWGTGMARPRPATREHGPVARTWHEQKQAPADLFLRAAAQAAVAMGSAPTLTWSAPLPPETTSFRLTFCTSPAPFVLQWLAPMQTAFGHPSTPSIGPCFPRVARRLPTCPRATSKPRPHKLVAAPARRGRVGWLGWPGSVRAAWRWRRRRWQWC